MNNVKRERKVKIYTKHIYSSGKSVVVPEIRLCGKWLTELGFVSGSQIAILCNQNEIHIKVVVKIDEQATQ